MFDTSDHTNNLVMVKYRNTVVLSAAFHEISAQYTSSTSIIVYPAHYFSTVKKKIKRSTIVFFLLVVLQIM